MKKSTKKRWRNRLIFVLLVAGGIFGFIVYINSFDPYDFSHLTVSADFGESSEFVPLGDASVPGMYIAARSDTHVLYVNPENKTIAVHDLSNGFVWHSRPPGADDDPLANAFEVNIMTSHIGFRYYDHMRRRITRWTYADSVSSEQAEIFSIPNGIRIVHTIGDASLGIDAIPPFIEIERFEERVRAQVEDPDDHRWLARQWFESRDYPGFMALVPGIRDSRINTNRMLDIFYAIGYTLEELEYDNAVFGIEVDINLDFFVVPMEFVLHENVLIVNINMDSIEIEDTDLVERIDLMRFFGAGAPYEEGFILVPSGSGGLIMFNNGKHREEQFMGAVYGLDALINDFRPQVMQPVRLPLFGIKREGAAMLAHIYSGSALATINTSVAGGTNSYNQAWFSFGMRSSMSLDMAILDGLTSDMTVVQPYAYPGDLTVMFRFLSGDDANLGGLARAYQDFLVAEGKLTPLSGPGNRSMYLDVIGAADVERRIFGTPYMSTQVMTSFSEISYLLDLMNEQGVETIQLQLFGWFNRGLNHDVAKNIRPIRGMGSIQEMAAINERLVYSGGGLFPAVNFQFTNYRSRNFNRTFEVARDPAGYLGFMSDVARDLLTTRFTIHRNNWFVLVSPAVLPFHVDSFIPAFSARTNIPNLALTDLGDILSESMYRRNAVDREHSRLIAIEQMGRLYGEFPNIMISGGNDYALGVASHLVGVPTEADLFYVIDHSVPFYQMVMHGFIEFAGSSVNISEYVNVRHALLISMATGASPRYTLTARPAHVLEFSPHVRNYSTYYRHWLDHAVEHYRIFNDVHKHLRGERIVDFAILYDERSEARRGQVTVTEFENGTRIFVNSTGSPFSYNGIDILPQWFHVEEVGS